MTETIPAPYINEPAIGYLYVALLSKNAQNQITELLASMQSELPGVIWTMPAEALHITLCEIVQSRKLYREDKDALFERDREAYVAGVTDTFKDIPVFSVTFDQIEVSRDAIIVRTQDGTPFNDIRAKLLGHISLPDETKQPPDIIHSSIARYQQAIDIETVQAVADKHSINFVEEIAEFKLVKTTVPPLLQYQELVSFPLQ